MQKGFIFDLNRCTGCSACQIACSIENQVSLALNWRQVLTFNAQRLPDLPFHHLSQACNHCIDPPCLKYCPSLAIHKNDLSGAVIIDPGKCIGCRYCSWVCPYDAPKYNKQTQVMEKCTFCQHRLEEHLLPVCVALCPTSALSLGNYDNGDLPEPVAGFTRNGIKPAVKMIPLRSIKPVMDDSVLPFDEATLQQFRNQVNQRHEKRKIYWLNEWPLIIFTVLAAILNGLLTARLLAVTVIPAWLIPALAAGGFFISALHLGKKTRAVRALLNWRHSWLSREIVAYATFTTLLFLHLLFMPAQTWLGWLALVPGYYTLFAMDKIYTVLPLRFPQKVPSAQVFLSGLYFSSVLSDVLPAALLFGLIKLLLYFKRKVNSREIFHPVGLLLSLARITAGFVIPSLMITSMLPNGRLIILLSLVAGELIDRAGFYHELDLITPEKQMKQDFERQLVDV